MCALFCKCNQNWVTSYIRNFFFPLFWGYKRKWNHSSVTPAVSAKQNWPQLSAGYKFQSQEKSAGPTVCTVSVEIGVSVEIEWDEAAKDVERFGSQKKPKTFGRTWFRLKLRWQKQYSPSVIVSGLVLQAWGLRHQLPIKIPVYCVAEVFLWLMEPMCVRNVSLQVSRCQIQSDDCEVS